MYVAVNIQKLWRKYFYRVQALSNELAMMLLGLIIHQLKRMRRIVLSFATCLCEPKLFTLFHKMHEV